MSQWVDVDTRNHHPHRQIEIHRPSARGYYYDIVWTKDVAVKKGDSFKHKGETWTIAELFGVRRM